MSDDYEGSPASWGQDYMLNDDVLDDFNYEGQEIYGDRPSGIARDNARDSVDEWLSQNDPKAQGSGAMDVAYESREGSGIGGASQSGLLEHRLSNMSPGVRNAFNVYATSLSGDNFSSMENKQVASNFKNVTGESLSTIARRASKSTDAVGTVTNAQGHYVSSSQYSKADMRMAKGMVSPEGMAKYNDRGPGGFMEGNIYAGADAESAYRAKLTGAFQTIDTLAHFAVSPGTEYGTQAYFERFEANRDDLISRAMGTIHGTRNKFPTPNEFTMSGRVTQGNGTDWSGTPFTPQEFSFATYKTGEVNDRGFPDIAAVAGGRLEGVSDPWRFNPNARRSWGLADTAQMTELNDLYAEAGTILRETGLSEYDISLGNKQNMSAYQQTREDWNAQTDARNDVAVPLGFTGGVDHTTNVSEADSPWTMPLSDGSKGEDLRLSNAITNASRGTSRGGIYGDRTLTELDIHLEDTGNSPEAIVYADNARGRYLEANVNSPKQGTAAWHSLRRDKDTASTIGLAAGADGVRKLAYNKVASSMNVTNGFSSNGAYTDDTKFVGNSYTAAGNKYEARVEQFFKRHIAKRGVDMSPEEAFFEAGTGDLDGFGVSPDAVMFNADGERVGLAEYKYLSSERAKVAGKTYYDQAQLQMAVTGDDVVFLNALDKDNDILYPSTIKADKNRQAYLINQVKAARKLANGMNEEGAIEMLTDIRKNSRASAKEFKKGQDTAYAGLEAEEPMTPFGGAAAGGSSGGEGSPPNGSKPAGAAPEEDPFKGKGQGMGTTNQLVPKSTEIAIKSLGENIRDLMSGFEGYTDAVEENTESSYNMAKVVNTMVATFGEGIQTGMATERNAAVSGFGGASFRYAENAAKLGGMSAKGAAEGVMAAGRFSIKANTRSTVASTLLGINSTLGSAMSEDVRSMSGVSMSDIQRPEMEVVASLVDATKDFSESDRYQVMNAYSLGSWATYQGAGKDLIGTMSKADYDAEKARSAYRGWVAEDTNFQQIKEGAAQNLGETGGKFLRAGKEVLKYGSKEGAVVAAGTYAASKADEGPLTDNQWGARIRNFLGFGDDNDTPEGVTGVPAYDYMPSKGIDLPSTVQQRVSTSIDYNSNVNVVVDDKRVYVESAVGDSTATADESLSTSGR